MEQIFVFLLNYDWFCLLIIQNFQYCVWIVVSLTRKHTVADILMNAVRKIIPNVYSVVGGLYSGYPAH